MRSAWPNSRRDRSSGGSPARRADARRWTRRPRVGPGRPRRDGWARALPRGWPASRRAGSAADRCAGCGGEGGGADQRRGAGVLGEPFGAQQLATDGTGEKVRPGAMARERAEQCSPRHVTARPQHPPAMGTARAVVRGATIGESEWGSRLQSQVAATWRSSSVAWRRHWTKGLRQANVAHGLGRSEVIDLTAADAWLLQAPRPQVSAGKDPATTSAERHPANGGTASTSPVWLRRLVLYDFIELNRDELVARTSGKVASRPFESRETSGRSNLGSPSS